MRKEVCEVVVYPCYQDRDGFVEFCSATVCQEVEIPDPLDWTISYPHRDGREMRPIALPQQVLDRLATRLAAKILAASRELKDEVNITMV
jgi:hypothetical protein